MAEYIQRSYIRKMAMLEMAYTMETETDAAVVLRMIEDAPTADVAPVVHGQWETSSDRPDSLICSVCKCGFDMWKHDPHNYCPNCGTRMDGGADND